MIWDDTFTTRELLRVLVRLVAAMVFGAAIGWERERRNVPAGLRTHILVAVGSASFMLMGLEIAQEYPGTDPIRIMQGIAVGVGFLGAGTILKQPEQHDIQGLTTAAGIWLTAALGVAVGAGRIIMALVLAVLTLIVLTLLRRLERREDRAL